VASSMDHGKNCSACNHPECSTPILTVSIPDGFAINLLGIHVEACPICITVYRACPDLPVLPAEDMASDASGKDNHRSCTVAVNGTQLTVIACQEKGSHDRGEPEPRKQPKSLKHSKPPKSPKPLKHPKLSKRPKSPKPSKHPEHHRK
jgi:hypothetical protein